MGKPMWSAPDRESVAIVKMQKNHLEVGQTESAATEVNQGRRVAETEEQLRTEIDKLNSE